MSSYIYFILGALLISVSAGRESQHRGSQNQRTQRPPRDRYLRLNGDPAYGRVDEMNSRSNRIRETVSKDDGSAGNFNTIYDEPPQNVCSPTHSMLWFCKELTYSDLLDEYRLKLAYISEPNAMEYFVSKKNSLIPIQKRTRASSCDCRRKNKDFATSKPIYLGSDHYPQFLPSNVTCDSSRCSNSTMCEPTKYQVKVLVKRKTNAERLDVELPIEFRRCWYSKVYTVLTDCMCVYET